MQRLVSWLQKEAFGWKIPILILSVTILSFVYLGVLLGIWYIVGSPFDEHDTETGIRILRWYFPFMLFGFAYFEEIIFRFTPIFLARTFLGKFFGASWGILIVALVASVLFGLVHGSPHNIYVQGVSGMLYSLLFLKCGGFQDHWGKATFVSTTAHFIRNGILALIVLLSGGTSI